MLMSAELTAATKATRRFLNNSSSRVPSRRDLRGTPRKEAGSQVWRLPQPSTPQPWDAHEGLFPREELEQPHATDELADEAKPLIREGQRRLGEAADVAGHEELRTKGNRRRLARGWGARRTRLDGDEAEQHRKGDKCRWPEQAVEEVSAQSDLDDGSPRVVHVVPRRVDGLCVTGHEIEHLAAAQHLELSG